MFLDSIEVQIIFGVLITSIISGFLGMGGGMILMVLYSTILPVKLAMILHGITQLSSNGFRAHLHRNEIKWSLVSQYVFAALIVLAIFKLFKFIPDKSTIYILLGSFPFIAFLPLLSAKFSINKLGRPFACGAAVTIAQLLAGASGAILDIFFINSPLSRHQIIATKALTQTIGHSVKLAYYFSLISSLSELKELPVYIYFTVIGVAFIGARIGKVILDNLSDINFRRISRGIILLTASTLLYKGFSLI